MLYVLSRRCPRCCCSLLHPNRYNFKITVRTFYNDTKNNTMVYAPFIAGMRTRSPAFSFSVPVGDRVSGAVVTPQESSFVYKINVSWSE